MTRDTIIDYTDLRTLCRYIPVLNHLADGVPDVLFQPNRHFMDRLVIQDKLRLSSERRSE